MANAVERGAFVYVYDDRGHSIFTVPSGRGTDDGLKGYTQSRVSVRRGAFTYSYDKKGRQAGTLSAK